MIAMGIVKNRIQSIDVLRGLVMVIMALDHVRDFFSSFTDDPLNLQTTTPQLYFTRWITHFCAPVFVFLSGSSIYLMSLRKTKAQLSAFLIKRGFWLIFIEMAVITLGWTFDPFYHLFILQVIWVIGCSMVILGILIYLPYTAIFALGLFIVLGHNLLDYPEAARHDQVGFWWDLLHHCKFSFYAIDSNHAAIIVYAIVPWLGIMLVGFGFGKLFSPGVDPVKRRKTLISIGLTLIALFIGIRMINLYGDAHPWTVQRNSLFSFLSFMNVNKYPPSLLYTCATLGPAIILLALLERANNKVTAFFNIYGRVPMFYYILHFYLIHIICVVLFFASGYSMKDAYGKDHLFGFRPNLFGYSLWVVYAIWLFVVLALYPLCKKYNRYKSTHDHWWLSYL